MAIEQLAKPLQAIAKVLKDSGYAHSNYGLRRTGGLSKGFVVQAIPGGECIRVFFIGSDSLIVRRTLREIEQILRDNFEKDYAVAPPCMCMDGFENSPPILHIHMYRRKS